MKLHRQSGCKAIVVSALCAALLSGACGDDGAAALDAALPAADAPDAAVWPPELSDLSLSITAALVPAFDPAQLSYQVDATVLPSDLRVTPTALEAGAFILVNGIAVASGAKSGPIALDLGANQITVQVTATNGETATYQLELTRGSEVISQLAYGKASNTQASDQFGVSVALSGDTLAVAAMGEASGATGVDGDQADNRLAMALVSMAIKATTAPTAAVLSMSSAARTRLRRKRPT